MRKLQNELRAKHRLTGHTPAFVGVGRNAALMPLYALFDEDAKQESWLWSWPALRQEKLLLEALHSIVRPDSSTTPRLPLPA